MMIMSLWDILTFGPSACAVLSELEWSGRTHVIFANCFHCWPGARILYSSSFGDFSLKSIPFRSECRGLTLPRSVLRMSLKEICKSFARRFVFDFLPVSYVIVIRLARGFKHKHV